MIEYVMGMTCKRLLEVITTIDDVDVGRPWVIEETEEARRSSEWKKKLKGWEVKGLADDEGPMEVKDQTTLLCGLIFEMLEPMMI